MLHRIVVGRVVKPHGIRGEIVVQPETEAPEERFASGARLFAGDPDGDASEKRIVSSRAHHDRFIVRFESVADRDGAEALRGVLLSIPESEALQAGPDRYYPYQLEGLDVVDEDGVGLGVLAGVVENPGNDLWVVRTPTGNDVLVPAVKAFIRAVDLEARRIVIRPIPGLFEEE